MQTFDFTFVVDGIDPDADDFEDRFFEAGCDDSTLVLMHGAVAVCFDREAETYDAAVLSAYRDVLSAGATISRFEPDYLVSASEIADRAGLSRAAVSLYANGERGENFPKPYARITTPSPMWDWVDVSKWLCQKGTLDEVEYRSAQVSRVINFNVQKNEGISVARKEVAEALATPVAA